MSSNLGIKKTCDNCAEACAEKLPAWKCKTLFRPTEDALKNRIAELTRLLKEQIAHLAMILKSKNDGLN